MEPVIATETQEVSEPRAHRKKGRHGLGHVYEHRQNWWLDVGIRGRRHRVKLGPVKLLEKREAREIANERIKQLLLPKPEPEEGTTGMTVLGQLAQRLER